MLPQQDAATKDDLPSMQIHGARIMRVRDKSSQKRGSLIRSIGPETPRSPRPADPASPRDNPHASPTPHSHCPAKQEKQQFLPP